ncbi:MAG: DUF2293 domain-containing protein [Bacillota bacterium]
MKEWGRYWLVVRRRPRYTETLGLLTPEEAVAGARRLAEKTEEVRGRRHAASARAREKAEERYGRQLEQAILAYLDFGLEHAALAEEIARGAAAWAAVVGSGRVGRTRKLTLEEKTALAARAWIRHRYTRYYEMLEQAFAEDSTAASRRRLSMRWMSSWNTTSVPVALWSRAHRRKEGGEIAARFGCPSCLPCPRRRPCTVPVLSGRCREAPLAGPGSAPGKAGRRPVCVRVIHTIHTLHRGCVRNRRVFNLLAVVV